MIKRYAPAWVVAVLLSGCSAESPVDEPKAARKSTIAKKPASEARDAEAAQREVDPGRYSSIDPSACRLLEQNIEEGGYSRHRCGGLAGYAIEISDSDLRQDIVIIAPDRRRAELDLSSVVAKGAFNSLGKTAEWRGGEARPTSIIVRLNVARGPEPTRPDISNLVVARLAPPACVVAVVPPGPKQNAEARRIADGHLPTCIGR